MFWCAFVADRHCPGDSSRLKSVYLPYHATISSRINTKFRIIMSCGLISNYYCYLYCIWFGGRVWLTSGWVTCIIYIPRYSVARVANGFSVRDSLRQWVLSLRLYSSLPFGILCDCSDEKPDGIATLHYVAFIRSFRLYHGLWLWRAFKIFFLSRSSTTHLTGKFLKLDRI
jgi:hypothetical protein